MHCAISALESSDVAPDAPALRQAHDVAVRLKQVAADAGAQRGEGAAERGAGALLPVLGVQQRRQRVARAHAIRAGNRKVGQCSHSLARVQLDGYAAAFYSWWAEEM